MPLSVRHLRSALAGPFDLEVADGGCAVLTGPSGVGKSLFLRMIADLDPNEGEVALDGRPREAMPAPAWRRLVTYLPAESGWWADRVDEHLADAAAARALLPRLGLAAELVGAPVARLSTGERQRLALVRALVQKPRFLLLDEPSSALDAESTRRLEALLAEERRGGTGLVVVSHDEAQAARLGGERYRVARTGLERVA